MTGATNSAERYGWVAMMLHWVMAALLVALVAMGFYMVALPDVAFDRTKVSLILAHKQLGAAAFCLGALRLAWRVSNTLPALAAAVPDWQKVTARFVHLWFYALILALPITGWLISSAAGFPVAFAGATLPDLVERNEYLFERFVALHRWLAFALITLFFPHAGAALRHHFLLRDDTLRRMLPVSRH